MPWSIKIESFAERISEKVVIKNWVSIAIILTNQSLESKFLFSSMHTSELGQKNFKLFY